MHSKRQQALNDAKRLAKVWYKNGWGTQVIYCYDVTYPDGSRDIGIRDQQKLNGFEFIFVRNAFAVVSYDGHKLYTSLL